MSEARTSARSTRGVTRGPVPLLLLTLAACNAPAPAAAPIPVPDTAETAPPNEPDAAAPVLTGVDVLDRRGAGPLSGLAVGLITNHTGRTRDGRSTIDVLHGMPGVELRALFGPEHGIRGSARAGERIQQGRDTATGLPVHSLYDDTRAPTAAETAALDALVFDMQDVGSRYYTYVWTMALALRAAAEHDLRFVVLDRPNPITGAIVQGNVLDTAFASSVGMYPVAMRHGLTAGEIARFVNGEYDIGARLEVVPVHGWTRDTWFDQTGLEWIPPSPNMPSLESALHYPGTCLFEQTSLSVGRGLPTAFQQIGAPWLEHRELARRLNARGIPGVRFEPVTFPAVTPHLQSHLGEKVPGERRGVRFVATERNRYDPVAAALAALVEIRDMHPDRLEFAVNFDAIAGTDRVRRMLLAGAGVDEIMGPWPAGRGRFLARRAPYLLYPARSRDDSMPPVEATP